MLKPWSHRLDLTTQPVLWLDVERRKVDATPAMSTLMYTDGDLVTYVHDEQLRAAAEASGHGSLQLDDCPAREGNAECAAKRKACQ